MLNDAIQLMKNNRGHPAKAGTPHGKQMIPPHKFWWETKCIEIQH